MFGPTEIITKRHGIIHHRSEGFSALLKDTEARLKWLTHIPDDWAVVFVTGSGTLANEMVLASWPFETTFYPDYGLFSERLEALHQTQPYKEGPQLHAYAGYETAESKLTYTPGMKGGTMSEGEFLFCDMISGFPFYQPPTDCSIFTGVAFKQFRGTGGLSFIAASPGFVQMVLGHSSNLSIISSLSLFGALHHRIDGQTPHTPAMQQIADFNDLLVDFNCDREAIQIAARRDWIRHALPDGLEGIGEGPVFTFSSLPDWFMRNWGLYNNGGSPQAFLWNGQDRDYRDFCNAMRQL